MTALLGAPTSLVGSCECATVGPRRVGRSRRAGVVQRAVGGCGDCCGARSGIDRGAWSGRGCSEGQASQRTLAGLDPQHLPRWVEQRTGEGVLERVHGAADRVARRACVSCGLEAAPGSRPTMTKGALFWHTRRPSAVARRPRSAAPSNLAVPGAGKPRRDLSGSIRIRALRHRVKRHRRTPWRLRSLVPRGVETGPQRAGLQVLRSRSAWTPL